MIIGNFTDHGDQVFAGRIYGIGISIPFAVFRPTTKSGNGPDYVVFGGTSEDEGNFELGAAWRKTSKKGKAYLSVKLDSPALVAAINCALTEQPNGSHALVWNRREEADEQAAA
jgi:uncharacterized protein (DUF736 family)